MNHDNTVDLLAYIQVGDNRQIAKADIAFWMNVLPEWLDLQTAVEAVNMFFNQPIPDGRQQLPYLDPRHVIYFGKQVRRRRETEKARERAYTPAIKPPPEVYTPPADFREMVEEAKAQAPPPQVHTVRPMPDFGRALKQA